MASGWVLGSKAVEPSYDSWGTVISGSDEPIWTWGGGQEPVLVGSGRSGDYYKMADGSFNFVPWSTHVTPSSVSQDVVRNDVQGSAEARKQDAASNNGLLGMGGFGDALLIGGLAVTGLGLAGIGPLAGAFGGEAALGAAGTGLSDLAAFEAAAGGGFGGEAVLGAAAPNWVNTAFTGAAKSAAVNGAVQLATTGNIDPGKLVISAATGGFGSVLGNIVGDATGMPFAGQVAGAVGGAVVGGALSGGGAAASGAVGGGTSTGSSGAPTVNPSNLSFSNPGIINRTAPRSIDWSTPRLNWSGA